MNFGDLSASKKEIPEVVSTIDVSLNCPGTDQDGRSDESEKVFKLDTSLEAKNNTAIFEDNYLAQNQVQFCAYCNVTDKYRFKFRIYRIANFLPKTPVF